jgi:putative sensory transduction regulator
MALSLDQIKKLVDGHGLRYFLDPSRGAFVFSGKGGFGMYQFLILHEQDGQFLQFRTYNYLYCPATHPHLPALLRVLADINLRRRLVKYGWDARDGEIVGYVDTWLMDSAITQQQFSYMLNHFWTSVDMSYARLHATMETSKDPGDEAIEKKLQELTQKSNDPVTSV